MAFPTSPSNNQVHKEGNRTFVYDSVLGTWDRVQEINRALVPNTAGTGGVPLSAPSLTTDSIRMTPRGGDVDVSIKGTMYFNNSDGSLYISNGTSWIRVSNNMTATGGTKTTHGIYTVHSFTSGTTTWTPDFPGNVDILLVAGGGGAGSRFHAGGGGGGGVRQLTNVAVTQTAYTIVVGAGGAGGNNPANENGTKGSNTTMSGSGFTKLTATGGGAGAGYGLAGGSGGSGGGGNGGGPNGGASGGGSGNEGGFTPVEGYDGIVQDPSGPAGSYHAGGGGGGAGAVGGNVGKVADGGDGINNDWRTGTNVGYGGGGCGSTGYSSSGHSGTPAATHGGGAMNTAGGTNTGGGGGATSSSTGNGATGGSGIVVIRYLT